MTGTATSIASGLPEVDAELPVTRLYRNDGDTFVRVDTGLPGVFSGDVAWADYDGEGDLDLALMGDIGDGIFITRLYRNDGGRFAESATELPGLAFGSLDWGDFDRDGDPDLLLTGGHLDPRFLRGQTTVFRNDGGTLVDGGYEFDGHVLGEARWGDADRDGDLDVFAIGASEPLGHGVLHVYMYDGSRFIPTWHETGVRNASMDVGGARMQFMLNRDYFECISPSWVPLFQPFGNCR